MRRRRRSRFHPRHNQRRAKEFGPGPSTRSEIVAPAFAFYAQESNIGGDVQFNSASDIVWFVPRAAVVGFFAPFPRMWFEAGSYGAAGRVLSGSKPWRCIFSTSQWAFALWRERRRLAMWLVFLTATAGFDRPRTGRRKRGRALSTPLRVLDHADCNRRAGDLLDDSTHDRDEVVNVVFRRVKRAHNLTSEIASFQT